MENSQEKDILINRKIEEPDLLLFQAYEPTEAEAPSIDFDPDDPWPAFRCNNVYDKR